MPLDRVIRITTDTEAEDDRRDRASGLSRPPEERIRLMEELRRQWPGYCDATGAPHRLDRRVWAMRDVEDPDPGLGRQTSTRP